MTRLIQAAICTALVTAAPGAFAETRTTATSVSIRTYIDIPRPVGTVWQALADTAAYPDWNPYHIRVEGDLTPGATLEVDVSKPNGNQLTIRPHVLEVEPMKALVWGGGPRGIFRGEHRFDLEARGKDCTRLHHTEVFSGLFVRFAELDSIEEGYVGMNEALARHLSADESPACAG